MSSETIKVIIKNPDEQVGHEAIIPNTLEALQEAVGGYIEPLQVGRHALIVNEEGKLRGLAPNIRIDGDVLVGPVVLVGVDGEEFTDIQISFETWKALMYECNMVH